MRLIELNNNWPKREGDIAFCKDTRPELSHDFETVMITRISPDEYILAGITSGNRWAEPVKTQGGCYVDQKEWEKLSNGHLVPLKWYRFLR